MDASMVNVKRLEKWAQTIGAVFPYELKQVIKNIDQRDKWSSNYRNKAMSQLRIGVEELIIIKGRYDEQRIPPSDLLNLMNAQALHLTYIGLMRKIGTLSEEERDSAPSRNDYLGLVCFVENPDNFDVILKVADGNETDKERLLEYLSLRIEGERELDKWGIAHRFADVAFEDRPFNSVI